jgi:hypothetical protein
VTGRANVAVSRVRAKVHTGACASKRSVCEPLRPTDDSAIQVQGMATLSARPPYGPGPAKARRKEAPHMTLGPLEYTVVGFQGNNFTGRIADELGRVVDNGTIRVVDLVFVMKDVDGEAAVVELDATEESAFKSFAPLLDGLMGLLTPEDIAAIAEGLPANTSALIILFEHRWAERLKDAMADAGGFLISREYIVPEALAALNAELEAAAV